MHKVREGSRMQDASKAKVDFLLGFEGGGFENVFKLFENRIPLRGDQKGRANRAMRLKNGPGPKVEAKPVTNIIGGHPEEVISKSIKSLKKTRHYRGESPNQGGRGKERCNAERRWSLRSLEGTASFPPSL